MSTNYEANRIDDFSSLNRNSNLDINVYTCGSERCEPDHAYGPTVRSGYMVYFVLAGEGSYTVRNQFYALHSGQGFIIEPHTLIRFQADHHQPWTYLWIGFSGRSAGRYLQTTTLNNAHPIFEFAQTGAVISAAQAVIAASHTSRNRNLLMTGKLYEFLYQLSSTYPSTEVRTSLDQKEVLETALFFIANNYSEQISVKEIAASLHIDRTYLHRLFVRHVGQSPQQYIKSYRIQRATQLLLETSYPIQVIAHAVGYQNPFSFSKAFSQLAGCSPRKYRAQHHPQ
ncbi:AraC family transcriptional regulator [Lacticaseibacillus jixianensis]|uniref:AraC family transcriptional regulator n=1 Tax=Lacticaseibacillus jixianensis TaxID=2486012 RepID=A0ABW4B9N5_9LACO|nr:AraC family transcriptional regulator [Lacticaseibacillus jixianensis]